MEDREQAGRRKVREIQVVILRTRSRVGAHFSVSLSAGGDFMRFSAELVEIREAVGAAQPAAPLDRLVAIGKCDAIDAKQGRPLGHLEVRRGERIGADRADALLGGEHADAADALVEAVYGSIALR